jgi:oligopeptide transport system substrate-binding protein
MRPIRLTRREALKAAGLGALGFYLSPALLSRPAQAAALEITIPLTEPPSLDPAHSNDLVSIHPVKNLFEGLVDVDDQGRPQPLTAESWEISSDGTVYTFKIRAGAKWSDGQPVTAHDFEYAMKRNLDPATANDAAFYLYALKGAEEFNTGKATDSSGVGIKAADDQTLVATLKEPAAYYFGLLTTIPNLPVRKDVVDKFGDKWFEAGNIVANGAYAVDSWRHDDELALIANPHYWGGTPAVSKATYKLFAQGDLTTSQQLAAYENGELQWSEIPGGDRQRVVSDPKLSKQIVAYDRAAVYYIVAKSDKAPWSDARIRQALYFAIDPDKAVAASGGPAYPADSMISRSIVGRNPGAYPKRPDPDKARGLLADAGFPNGAGFPDFTYTTNANPQNNAMADFYQQTFKEVLNLNVKVQTMDYKTYGQWRRQNPYDLIRFIQDNDFFDPYSNFNSLFDSTLPSFLLNGWKNPQFDQVVEQAAREQDLDKRTSLYQQADAILAQEMPFIPVFQFGGELLVSPALKNVVPKSVGNYVVLKNIQPA